MRRWLGSREAKQCFEEDLGVCRHLAPFGDTVRCGYSGAKVVGTRLTQMVGSRGV